MVASTVSVFMNDFLEMKFVTSAVGVTSAAILTCSKATELFHLCTCTGNIVIDERHTNKNYL